MKRALITLFISLVTFSTAVSQTFAKITDVDFRIENNKIVVTYSITNFNPGEIYITRLTFITGDNKTIVPISVSGHVGPPGITGGPNKYIIWDIEKDRLEISGGLKAVVSFVTPDVGNPDLTYVSQEKQKGKHLGGPSYAILSFFVPGLGGYFVDEKIGRSAIVTTLGLATIGGMIYWGTEAQKFDNAGNDVEYDKATKAFQTLAVLYTGIIIYDVVYVLGKGSKNVRARSSSPYYPASGAYLSYTNKGLKLGYRLTF